MAVTLLSRDAFFHLQLDIYYRFCALSFLTVNLNVLDLVGFAPAAR